MRKLEIMEHISLDGVIQHSADDGDYSDWTVPYRTAVGREAVLAAYGESSDLLLGRRTYDLWSGFWPKAPNNRMADRLNAATKYIATHRPESLEWSPFEGLGPDIVEGIRRVKSQDGPDQTCGNRGCWRTVEAGGLLRIRCGSLLGNALGFILPRLPSY